MVTTPVDELASALIDKLSEVKFTSKIAYTIKELADAMGVGEGTIVGLRERGEPEITREQYERSLGTREGRP